MKKKKIATATAESTEILKDGMDSGKVSEKIKLQLLVDGLGICAAPICGKRAVRVRTRLGECAHILPKIVGSHPREDYKTPLEDRNKAENLLYLCEEHHKIADNKEHAQTYTVDILKSWKREHELWATNVTKQSPYLSPDLKAILNNFGRQIATQANASENIVNTLLETCQELVNRQLLKEARVFFAQIDLLLLNSQNQALLLKADLLDAILASRAQQIPDAKKQLLQIIQAYPHDAEAMIEYVELCDKIPEPGDEKERIEKLARDLNGGHPRLSLIDLGRAYKKQELVDLTKVPEKWVDNTRLNSRFLLQYVLFCDLAGNSELRDQLMKRWEKEMPTSPRPHYFKVLFKTADVFRAGVRDGAVLLQALEFSANQREKAKAKDPLVIHDQISWLIQEMQLNLVHTQISGIEKDSGAARDELMALITQCYFDNFIYEILPDLLTQLRITPEQWKIIIAGINQSRVSPSKAVIEQLFLQALQYDELKKDLEDFIRSYGDEDLRNLHKAILETNASTAANIMNSKKDFFFSLILLQSIKNPTLSLALTKLLEVEDEHKPDLLYARLKALSLNKQDKEALELIASFSIEDAAPFALTTIETIAYRNKQWHLFIPPAIRLLQFDIPSNYRTQLHGELATAFFQQGDDSNAIVYAEKALENPSELGKANTESVLHILGEAYRIKGLANKACEKFGQYQSIKKSFAILLHEADLHLKSTLQDKYEKALSLIIEAFEQSESYDDKVYLSAFLPLVELANAKKIPLQNELTIAEGVFIKIDGFANWFYVGDEQKSLGAVCIKPGSPNYEAVIGKILNDEIQWPAEKFSRKNEGHKILQILTPPAFLSYRAHEAMESEARLGTGAVWAVQVLNEDDTLDKENLNQFCAHQFKHSNEFFETYANSLLPFSFLCRMEGGLAGALGKISSERKGFVRCNNGSQADIDTQELVADESIKGKPCHMDGLTALVLAEAKLLEKVIQSLPNLSVSTSVVRLLRTIAANFAPSLSNGGRAAFVGGNFQFRSIDKENDQNFSNQLLEAANLLDALPNKVVGKTYPKSEEERDLDHLLPDYFVDAFRFSQEGDAHILTDDSLLVQAYKVSGYLPIPKHFSSLSLIRVMAKKKLITWEEYYKYFSLLAGYRYHLLPISVDEMLHAIMPPTVGGLVAYTPKNLLHLNLQLTLSQEYGVSDDTLIRILSPFFIRIINDGTIPTEIADEIFAYTIVKTLAKRDKKFLARVILQICHPNMPSTSWRGDSCHQKLDILAKQLVKFSQDFDPIILEAPGLLRINAPLN